MKIWKEVSAWQWHYVLQLKEQVDVHARRAAVLRALPAYLHEDLDEANSIFPKKWDVSHIIYLGQIVIFFSTVILRLNYISFNIKIHLHKYF